MARRQLNSRILVLDRQLILEQWQLRSNGRRCLEQLRGVSPLGLLSTGFVAGLLAGWLVSASSYHTYAIFLDGMRLWRLSDRLLPGATGRDRVEYPE